MKLLLDAQLSYLIADELTRRGHDVDALTRRSDIPNNLSDDQVLELAQAEGRVVVTNNVRDFRNLAAERTAAGSSHAGLILVPASVPRTRASVASLADALEEKIREFPDGLAGSETWVARRRT